MDELEARIVELGGDKNGTDSTALVAYNETCADLEHVIYAAETVWEHAYTLPDQLLDGALLGWSAVQATFVGVFGYSTWDLWQETEDYKGRECCSKVEPLEIECQELRDLIAGKVLSTSCGEGFESALC